ncbi:MAG TPA: glycosyltransferase family 39 protein [Ignavibacteriaceae bacterium]|nr:glycosyltransferase family 39 protein [Ignavibacteriaceae bacterium]
MFLSGTVIIVVTTNFFLIQLSPPYNIDSMTYHLARMAYYIQHNNLDYFEANYWAQVVHPKNSTILFIYIYLVSGRSENLIQYVQFSSYLIAICSIYLITFKCWNDKVKSLFAALISALLIEWIMESVTTQNDMIITALTGCSVYFLISFKEKLRLLYLVLFILTISIAVGTKFSALMIFPSLLIIFIFPIKQLRQYWNKKILYISTISGIIFFSLFTLRSSYWDNYKFFGHPFGPKEVRNEHSFEGKSFNYIVESGLINVFRYSLDFLSLDGMVTNPIEQDLLPSNFTIRTHFAIKLIPKLLAKKFELDYNKSENTRVGFFYYKMPTAWEDLSYWGIFGFGLIWISLLFTLINNKIPLMIRILTIAALLFFIVQCFIGPYDPWRGRYFMAMAIFAVPSSGLWISTKKIYFNFYLFLIVFIGVISALFSVYYKPNLNILPNNDHEKNYFKKNRIEQLTIYHPQSKMHLTNFDKIVPKNAIVGVDINGASYEYPLFGVGLTRKIIPVNKNKNIDKLDYYLYRSYLPYEKNDLYLGDSIYLRNIKINK